MPLSLHPIQPGPLGAWKGGLAARGERAPVAADSTRVRRGLGFSLRIWAGAGWEQDCCLGAPAQRQAGNKQSDFLDQPCKGTVPVLT